MSRVPRWVLQVDGPISAAEVDQLIQRWDEWQTNPSHPLILGEGVRLVDMERPSDFGQQTIGTYDPGWPTALVFFVSVLSGIAGMVAGLVLS